MAQIRLLKMIIQPVFVMDDGTTLEEQPGEPFTIREADIATFPETWAASFAQLREQMEPDDAPEPQDEP